MKSSRAFNKTRLNILSYLVIILLVIAITYFLTQKFSSSDSVFKLLDLLMSITNIAIIGYLTFLLYKVNVRLVDVSTSQQETNKNIAELTIRQVKTVEMKNLRMAKHRIYSYQEDIKLLMFLTYPNLSAGLKRQLIVESIRYYEQNGQRFYGNNLFFNNKINEKDLPDPMELLPETSTNMEVIQIHRIFNHAMPNSIKAFRKAFHAQDALERLLEIRHDNHLIAYSEYFNNLYQQIDLFENSSSAEILNINENTKFIDIEMNHFTADRMYFLLQSINYMINPILDNILEEEDIYR